MATKISKTKSTTKALKMTRKKPKNFTFVNKHKALILTMAAFGVIGVFLLIGANAANTIEIDLRSSDIVAGVYSYKPTTLTRDQAKNTIAYESFSNYKVVTADGTVICDDGNSVGTAKTTTLDKSKYSKIIKELEKTNYNKQKNQVSENSDEASVGNIDRVMFTAKNKSNTTLHSKAKPKANSADKVEKILSKVCSQEVRQTSQRSNLKTISIPKKKKKYSAYVPAIQENIASVLLPKVQAAAAPTSAIGSQNNSYADQMADWTNWDRGLNGRALLTRSNCLNTVAQNHAKEMMDAGNIFHTLPATMTAKLNECGLSLGYWTLGAENVGMHPGSVQGLEAAYMKSPGHRANILDSRANCVGHGVWTRTSDGKNFHVAIFARYPRCN
ncbi:MAG: CAP domain-containing protein [Candidatus Saccharimonadales bacterium]